MAVQSSSITSLVKRNFLSVLFPTCVIFSIWADLRHTTKWKRQLAEQEKQ